MRPYSEALFSAIFAEALPEVGEDVCLRRAEASACPGRRSRKSSLRRGLTGGSAGAFGVPTFVVDSEAFWGNDRLVLVRHHLGK